MEHPPLNTIDVCEDQFSPIDLGTGTGSKDKGRRMANIDNLRATPDRFGKPAAAVHPQ